MQLIEYPALAAHATRYDAMEMMPLRVTLFTAASAQLLYHDPINLDNLLARCVVNEATAGAGLPNEALNAYVLPVPLKCLWRSEQGLPLYAVTPFQPVGEPVTDEVFIHKRAQSGRWTGVKSGRFRLVTVSGRWMERRIPLKTRVCRAWQADAIGNPWEIVRLLSTVACIGKHRNRGFGMLHPGRPGIVEPLDKFCLVADGRLTRRLPVAAMVLLDGHAIPNDAPCPVGWTPPQWKSSLWLPGWLEGAACVCGSGTGSRHHTENG